MKGGCGRLGEMKKGTAGNLRVMVGWKADMGKVKELFSSARSLCDIHSAMFRNANAEKGIENPNQTTINKNKKTAELVSKLTPSPNHSQCDWSQCDGR
jgi:hypothetical protein